MSVSVVIPAFNASRYIAETLHSVLAQTLPPDEVIVVDDGSTDDTGAIAAAFGPPVRVVRIPNSKLPAARNTGTREATGEWVAFIDADDLWTPDKLARQMEALAAHPEADISYTGCVLLDQVGDTFELGRTVETPPANELDRWLFKDTSFRPSGVVIRRSVLLACGGFDTKMKYVEDWELWIRLFHAGYKFVGCVEPLLIYRVHDANMSRATMNMLDGVNHVYRTHIREHIPLRWRFLHYSRFWSRHEAEASFTLRKTGDGRCLSMMGRSILHWPFDDPHRYKVFAHMLYTRVRSAFKSIRVAL